MAGCGCEGPPFFHVLIGLNYLLQYHVAIQLISFVVIAPYMSMSRWESDFEPPALFRKVTPPW